MATREMPATAPPAQPEPLRMTYEQYQAWVVHQPGRTEWVNGEVVFHMAATPLHEKLIQFLGTLLYLFARFFKLGEVLAGPVEMKADPESNAREPDIFFLATAHLGQLIESRLAGPADLVVEVISDDSVARDRADKFYEYQDAGVREYWLVDPRPNRRRADFHVLDAQGQYQPAPIQDGIYRSTVLPGFWLRVEWLWTLPDPLLAFAEIVGRDKIIAALQEQGPTTS